MDTATPAPAPTVDIAARPRVPLGRPTTASRDAVKRVQDHATDVRNLIVAAFNSSI